MKLIKISSWMTLGCNFSAMTKHLCAGRWDFTARHYRGRSGWSQGLQRGAGVWCCNSQCYTCWAWQHILCKCHRGETLGCTSWSKQDCESPRSCVHGNVKWYPRMYQAENSPQRSRDANAIMQCAFIRNAAWQLWSPEVRQDKCKVGGGKAAKKPLNNEQKE